MIYGASALSFNEDNSNIIFAGIGSCLYIYEGGSVIQKHNIFPGQFRISGIKIFGDMVIIYAENIIKVIRFTEKYSKYEIEANFVMGDIIVTANISFDKNITMVLGHGQIIKASFEEILECIDWPDWKIAISALIVNDEVYVGDSFGNLAIYNLADKSYRIENFDKGAIFDITVNESEIGTAHEFHAVAKWNKSDLKVIYENYDHPSRVWRVCYINGVLTSFGEDGFMRFHDGITQPIQLHRGKNITSFAIKDQKIATAGYDGIIRIFSLPGITQISNYNLHRKAVTALALEEKSIISLDDGSILEMPSKVEIAKTQTPVFILSSGFGHTVGATRGHQIVFLDESGETVDCVRPATAICCTKEGAIAITVDNVLKIFDKCSIVKEIPLDEYFKKAPAVIETSENIVAIGSHGPRVAIFEFGDSSLTSLENVTTFELGNGGFQGIAFNNGDIYAAGRTDGLVYILSRSSENISTSYETTSTSSESEKKQKWLLKSSWQLTGGSKAVVSITSNNGRVLVAAHSKNSVSIFDIELQLPVATINLASNRSKLSAFGFSNTAYAISWDGPTAKMAAQNILNPVAIGQPFHGLRGLCATTVGQYLVTGSCDRDLRVYSFDDSIKFRDTVMTTEAGTHALCAAGSDRVFSGGSQQHAMEWLVRDGRLFKGRIFDFAPFLANSECKLRVTAMTFDSALFAALSDGSLIAVNDDLSLRSIELMRGVGIAMDSLSGVVAIATSVGTVVLRGAADAEKEIAHCGLQSIKLVEVGGKLLAIVGSDDTCVRVLSVPSLELVREFRGVHTGGVKSVDARVIDGKLEILSFSYDQMAHILHLDDETSDIETPISHGQAGRFVPGGVALFGAGLDFVKI